MKKIFDYCEFLTSEEDEILKQLRRETYLTQLMPRMISGHFQGKLLEFISKIKRPFKILEIGTFTGYSTICLAKGLNKGGKIITIEKNDELKYIISKYLKKANLENNAEVIFGDAMQILDTINETFDLVFIDADKRFYLEFYKKILPKTASGGIILADNIFWNGKVFDPVNPKDKYTQGIIRFSEAVKKDKSVEIITLPVRDGLMIIRKK